MIAKPEPDTNINSPVPGGMLATTYFVYIDDSGDGTQDILTALAIPVTAWTDLLEKWKRFRRWVDRKYGLPPNVELHAVDLGTNAEEGRRELAGLQIYARNKIAQKAFQILRSTQELRVLTVHAPVAEGSGDLYGPLIEFVEEFCSFHRSHAAVWYDGTAQNLQDSTKAVHRRLPSTRRVLEDPRGYSSTDSHFIQMADFIAYAAHQAILNDRGIGKSNTYLREHAYTALLPDVERSIAGLVWPGAIDNDGFPAFVDALGIRNYLKPKTR